MRANIVLDEKLVEEAMIPVDTSVLIDLFKGVSNEPANRMRDVLGQRIPVGITSVIHTA